MIINNKLPLRYPGGKTRACKSLDEILNKHFKIENYDNIISPFFGGGSFEFYLQNKYNFNIIANDKFTPLYNFWNSCKHNKDELCSKLCQKIETITKEQFYDLKKTILNENNNLIQAVSYFIINRCSFSGSTLSGGFSFSASKNRFTKSSIDRIKQLNLSNFSIYNYDFEEFINNNVNVRNLIFLDPPYYLGKKSKLYGNNGDIHECFDHDKLFECIHNKKNWIMTYNDCNYIRQLYKKFRIIEINWSYGMNKSKKSSEIVILG